MLNGIKDFAINKILRHVAENPKLDNATNLLALIPPVIYAALGSNTDWMQLVEATPAGAAARLKLSGVVVSTVLLYFTGKFPFLKSWLPVADEIIKEAETPAEPPK